MACCRKSVSKYFVNHAEGTVMLKYVNHDIVFQEFPDEVTLAINLSRCPCACPGCHSPYLWGDNGEELTEERLYALVEQYGHSITCVALMGGDNDPAEVLRLLSAVRLMYSYLHTGWYSGREQLPEIFELYPPPTYVKIGPWRADCGPLSSATTNQRMLHFKEVGSSQDITFRFQQKGLKV